MIETNETAVATPVPATQSKNATLAPAPIETKPGFHYADGSKVTSEVKQPLLPAVVYRAKFLVTDISKSSNGTTTIKLAAAYDHSIETDKALITGANPKGCVELAVNDKLGNRLAHGSVFYLVSA
jgi:hypothetical protein